MIPIQSKAKVVEITQLRITFFNNGILGDSWVKCFRDRHPQLVLRQLQGLNYKRARALNLWNIAQFNTNLESLYFEHNYDPKCIWNIDEFGCQTSQIGLGKVFAKRGIREIYKVIPMEREWLSALSTINAHGGTIFNYYMFKE